MKLINKNADYVDYEVDVVGDENRAVIFRLTYIINESRFYAIVTDTKTEWVEEISQEEISQIPDETAKFMLGADTYYELKGKGITRRKRWPSDFDGAHHVNKEQERLNNFNKNNPTNNLQDLM
tara:strand:- start:1 stop:369 length:369 start_codon:yes stop_codon:yes gene_type:complete